MFELKFFDKDLCTKYIRVQSLALAKREVELAPTRYWTFVRLKVLSNGALFDARYLPYLKEEGIHDESVR